MPIAEFEPLRVAASRKLEPKAQSRRAVSHLVAASVRAVGALEYLVGLDDGLGAADWSGRQPRDMVDAAHTRWAATSAVSALDTCAAVIWRVHSTEPLISHELDLRGLDPSGTKKHQRITPADRFNRLRPHWQTWVRATISDARYPKVLHARHALTHSSAPEQVTSGGFGHALRWRFAIGFGLDIPNTSIPSSAWTDSRLLVLECAGLTTERVRDFLEIAIREE